MLLGSDFMNKNKEIDAIKKAKKIVEDLKLDEPFRSITYKTLLDKFLQTEYREKPTPSIPKVTSEKTEIPQIVEESSCRDTIRKLLSTKWGRIPRSFREIKQALEMNAIYYSKNTLLPALTRMTKKGELRRLKKGNVFAYVSSRK